MIKCNPPYKGARSSMAEQWPFKPFVESSTLSELTKSPPFWRAFLFYRFTNVVARAFSLAPPVRAGVFFARHFRRTPAVSNPINDAEIASAEVHRLATTWNYSSSSNSSSSSRVNSSNLLNSSVKFRFSSASSRNSTRSSSSVWSIRATR
jgi:hypothetical protein